MSLYSYKAIGRSNPIQKKGGAAVMAASLFYIRNSHLWGYDSSLDTKTFQVHIGHLRKVEDAGMS